MNKKDVIAVQERLLDAKEEFPHLQSLGITSRKGDFLILATFTRAAGKKEKDKFVERAQPAPVRLGIQRGFTLFGE